MAFRWKDSKIQNLDLETIGKYIQVFSIVHVLNTLFEELMNQNIEQYN